ncbi:MAG: SDR family oxidoreductase [Thermoplasmatales archaeon]
MRGLRGKTALVSAASSGIGKGIAKVLASEGCQVHIFSRNLDRIKESAAEIEKETSNQVTFSSGDLSKAEDIRRIVGEVRKSRGTIDFLVMNYGDPKVAPFFDISESDWDISINMILKSTVLLTREFLPDMVKRRSGRVIFVTSLTTKQPMENFAISASLRAAVVALSKVLSLEFSQFGITFNSISQGYIMTPRLESIAARNAAALNQSIEKAYDNMMQGIPSKRFGRPEEIGSLVSYLCSYDASYINGANIQIDGGLVRFPF